MTARTFALCERRRADAEFSGCDLVHVETVHADGRVEARVVGTCDGEYVDKRSTRRAEMPAPLDLERVASARRRSGWREIEAS